MKTVIRTSDELRLWAMGRHGPLALDTETSSLNYIDLRLLGISLCDGKDACYIVWDNSPRMAAMMSVILLECVSLLVLHNAPFDLMVLKKYGIEHTKSIFCTMTAAHVIDERGPKKLKVLAHDVLGIPLSDILTWEQASQFGFDSPEFYNYAMNDVVWTFGLYQKFKIEIRKQQLEYVFYKVEMPFQFALRDLDINGILVDPGIIQSLIDQVKPLYDKHYQDMYDHAGVGYSLQYSFLEPPVLISNVNLNNAQVCAKYIEKLGFTVDEQTEGGQKSADKFTLKRLAGKHPFVDSLIQYRVYKTVYDTFLKNALSRIQADGRTRPSVNNCVTETGRLSYSNPNMQNMPKKGKLPVEFRTAVVARPGYKLIGADYSGQELRVLAHVSQDANMIKAFLNNQDLHLSMANQFYHLGIPDECLVTTHPEYEYYKDKFSKERNNAKIINFGIAYGKSPIGFAADFNLPVEEAEKIVDAYFKAAPGVKAAIDACHRQMYQCKYAVTLAGRRRRFDVINNRAKRQGFNHVIQGSSADMVKLAMGKMVDAFLPEWDAKLVLTVHDEVVVEAKEEYAEAVRDCMVDVMSHAMKLVVPLEVDAKTGDSYADIK